MRVTNARRIARGTLAHRPREGQRTLRGRVYAGRRRRRSVADEIFQAEPEGR
jgi:hypothetical protein